MSAPQPEQRPIHLEGAPVDHATWMAGPLVDDFDATAMEAAMTQARYDVFRALAEFDAA